jgi:DNA-binding protein Fis
MSGDTVRRSLAQVEAEHIRAVLASVGGNKSRAAGILGIDRKTLQNKLSS